MVPKNTLSDEFEFKPITEGLGFHKKVVNLQQEVQKSSAIKSELGIQVPSVPQELNKKRLQGLISKLPGVDILDEEESSSERELIKKALERDPLPTTADTNLPKFKFQPYSSIPTIRSPEVEAPSMNISIREDDSRTRVEEQEIPTTIPDAPVINTIQEIPFHIGPILFDSVVVLGLACLFSVGLMIGAEVDIVTVLAGASRDLTAQIGLGVLIFSIIELYVIVTRSVFGSTLGEWAFDIQLGRSKQVQSAFYPILIMWRTIVVAATGFVVLPFLSALFDKDITGRITGLKLFRNI